MPKWKNIYDKGRKYSKAWEKTKPWLTCATDGQHGYCIPCKVDLVPKLSSISSHENTKKHQKKMLKGTQEIQISINPGDQPYFGTESTEDKVDVPCILHEEPICIKTKPSNTEDTLAQAVRSLQEIAQKNDNSSPKTDEFDTFGVSVAGHLRQLPVDVALESQSEIFQYLVQRRLGHTSNL